MIKKKKIFLIIILIFCLFLLYIFLKPKNTNTKSKDELFSQNILLLGLDGAEWNIINVLIDKGELPNFEKMEQEGSFGYLISPYAYSPISWTDIATGKTKEKHNVTGWFLNNSNSYLEESNIITSSDIQSKRVWDILSENGINVGISHWLITWPPEEVNGFMISDFSSQHENTTFPPQLKELLLAKKFYDISKQPVFSVEEELFLLKNFTPDFFAAVDYSSDRYQHRYLKFLEPDKFGIKDKEKIEKYRETIYEPYLNMNYLLNEVMKNKTMIIFLVSDHGFYVRDDLNYEFYFNSLLNQIGLLTYSDYLDIPLLLNDSFIYQRGYATNLGNGIFSMKFYFANQFVNREELLQKLNKIKYMNTNESLFFNYSLKEDGIIVEVNTSSPSFISNLDIDNEYISLEYNAKRIDNLENKTLVSEISGDHTPRQPGIIIVKGSMIKENYNIKNATVYDITPTILYLYNIPIPRDMDGRVLTEIIKDDYLKSHPIKYTDKSSQWERQKEEIEVNQTLVQRIYEKLRSLGYII